MSSQQNAYLKAMGIDVWVEKTPTIPDYENIQKVEAAVPLSTPEPPPEVATSIKVDSLGWSALYDKAMECHDCNLSNHRKKIIFGSGAKTASLMVIGDAPNESDEQQGEPFSGETGKLLAAMLKAMGYQRNDVYISNLVKCRVPENQEPSIEEVTVCESYLLRQIKLVQPDLILVLGGVAAQRFLKSKSTLNRLRGQLHYLGGITVPVVVSFDLAYLLRAPNEKRKAWDDLQLAMKHLAMVKEKNKDVTSINESSE